MAEMKTEGQRERKGKKHSSDTKKGISELQRQGDGSQRPHTKR
jgi:hypothetical protein